MNTPSKAESSGSENESAARQQEQAPLQAKSGSTEAEEAKGRNDTKKASAEQGNKQAEDNCNITSSSSTSSSSSTVKPPAASEVPVKPDGEYYSYEELKRVKTKLDRTKLEAYLAPAEFPTVFGMTKEEFLALPGWKQKQKKDQKDLM